MNPSEINSPEPVEVSHVVEHLFRHEAGKMVATLAGIFGIQHLTLAEDVVQEALARALQTWPYYGVPKNPAAWIMRASRNLALDVVRRQRVFREKEAEIVRLMEQESPASDSGIFPEQEIADDGLRMMFVCCHPLVPPEAQAALALKTLCGFSVAEIARAFLTTEAAIAKRLTRAKQKIREARIPFEIPTGDDLARRLDGVLQSLYLLFNEGYKATRGNNLVREEICREAIRMAGLLAEHAAGNQPKTHALLALMLMNGARLAARLDGQGNLLRLQEQDRTRWDQPMIARGMFHLARSAAGEEITAYHLEAGIASCHCRAKDYASTDWRQILQLYDRMMEFDDSPVVALNRAVSIAEVHGPGAGLEAVRDIQNLQSLESYHLLYAVLGEFELRLNHSRAAAAHFRKSMQLAELKSEQAFLSKRLQACEDQFQALTEADEPETLAH
ncbi:MAG TPA: sigma-70 family RNA polymerase sigma factor [Candidatus Saccharimonadales bacterium]|nr:sigma-70 family RNA polymerase sigma factor [Candidatus Saccharimonadales bacterium]